MDILTVPQLIAVIGTFATGFYALFWPKAVKGFTGLRFDDGRGVTEIRAVMGGFFIGLAAAAFFLEQRVTYPMLGITYLAVAAVRLVSMFVDDSVVKSNIISLFVEIVFGVVLVL